MAKIERFIIENFKGIKKATIDLEDGKPDGRFVTLIGLNESGKTTVLEALSHSILADVGTSRFIETVQGSPEFNDLIPKREKAAFTGSIKIIAEITLDDSEIEKVRRFISSNFNLIPATEIPRKISVTKDYQFEDSSHAATWNWWTFRFNVTKRNGYKIYELSSQKMRYEWSQTVEFLAGFLPQIIYFPTFLIDFPKRIYLAGEHGRVDEYYREVVNDALCGLSSPLSIERHIIRRADIHRNTGRPFSSTLRGSPEGQQIDATVQELARELNRVIFGAWAEIFGKRITGKRINVEWHIDERRGRHVYLEIYIIDEDHVKFFVSERSLGFRWFFSFLLFTQFQSARANRARAVFLFDEPASHLHARAQQRLLRSFQKIAEPDHVIIYSTHSHYLINPLWLEKAYIVANQAIDPDEDDPQAELDESRTLISLTKYRQFVADHPSKTTYFQPALDALDYRAPPLATSGPAVLVEGKFDYYPLMFFVQALGKEGAFQVYPAGGAGTMGSIIALLRGWSVPFVILLDDDGAGRRERDRYIKEYLLEGHEVTTIGDLLPALAGKEFEAIFGSDVRTLFDQYGFEERKHPSKQDYHLLFHRLRAESAKPELKRTTSKFRKLILELEARLPVANN